MIGAVAWRELALAMLCVILVSAAQLSLKLGAAALPLLHADGLVATLQHEGAWAMLWLTVGLACYGLSLLLWIRVLMCLPLSVAYPLLSISYALVYLVATSWPAWGETATSTRSVGVGLIILGVMLVSLPVKSTEV